MNRMLKKMEAAQRELAKKSGTFVLQYATADEIERQIEKLARANLAGNMECIDMLLDRLEPARAATVRMGLWAFDPNVGKT